MRKNYIANLLILNQTPMPESFRPRETLQPSPEFVPIFNDLNSLAQRISGMSVPELKKLKGEMNLFLDRDTASEIRGLARLLQDIE